MAAAGTSAAVLTTSVLTSTSKPVTVRCGQGNPAFQSCSRPHSKRDTCLKHSGEVVPTSIPSPKSTTLGYCVKLGRKLGWKATPRNMERSCYLRHHLQSFSTQSGLHRDFMLCQLCKRGVMREEAMSRRCRAAAGVGEGDGDRGTITQGSKTSSSISSSGNIGNSRQMLVFVPPHPLIKHWIAVLRNEATPPSIFRGALAELGRLLIYEATRDWMPLIDVQVQTPLSEADVSFVDPSQPIKVVPILRAGLVMLEEASSLLPASATYHLGYVHDKETLMPSMYLNKLPQSFPEDSRLLIIDSTIATGGTLTAAIEELQARGADTTQMRVISAVCCPTGLQKLNKFGGLRIYSGIIDPEINSRGLIVPGIGDAGDRSFGT